MQNHNQRLSQCEFQGFYFDSDAECSMKEQVSIQTKKKEKKYLGLTIEKDAEYVLDPEDYDIRRNHQR